MGKSFLFFFAFIFPMATQAQNLPDSFFSETWECPPGYAITNGAICYRLEPEKPTQEDNSQPVPPPPPPCVNETRQAAAACQQQMSSAVNNCAGSKMKTYELQGNQTAQSLSGQENLRKACGETNSYQAQYGQGLSQFHSSCSNAVNQCVSACERAKGIAQSCNDSRARQFQAQILNGQSECSSSGGTGSRPGQIQAEIDSNSRALQESEQCKADSSSGGPKTGNKGPDQQEADGLTTRHDLLGKDGNDTNTQAETQRGTDSTTRIPSSNGIGTNETYDVSGKKTPSSASDKINPNAALAALPGTQIPPENKEQTDAQLNRNPSLTTVATATNTGLSNGSRRSHLRLPPRKGAIATKTNDKEEDMTPANKTDEEAPDLSAFLPSNNRLAGGVIAGLSNCRIPDPKDQQTCAIHHGPSTNIWLKTKERFEALRFMRPGQFFMNEE